MDYIIVELFGTNIDSLNERILTHLQMRKSSLRKIREVIREYAENLGTYQTTKLKLFQKSSLEKLLSAKPSHIGTILKDSRTNSVT